MVMMRYRSFDGVDGKVHNVIVTECCVQWQMYQSVICGRFNIVHSR